jgi:23S rRNA (cytosine1962-C5)-methyltransferase
LRQVIVNARAADALRRGHPWIWRQAIVRGLTGLAAGDEVVVGAEDQAQLGRGVADPESPIAVRMWTSGAPIDGPLLASRVDSALKLRQRLFCGDGEATTAYRVLNGEGDSCPGYVVDRYGEVAVLRVDGEGARARLDAFVAALWPRAEAAGVCTLVHRVAVKKGLNAERVTLRGPEPPKAVDVREHGIPFRVDLAEGQKTGAFLDQRENRRRVGGLARERRVLNLFSYAGGFSLHAALGGASHVTSVDTAAKAHATAQASFRLAGVDPRRHLFVAADAFAFLAEAKTQKKTWDMVVSDPPSFAPSEKALPRALAAYRALHRACVDVLADGGLFCAASCSSHVNQETFMSTLDAASLGRALRVLAVHGPPEDHPTVAAWAEGRYLKFVVMG